MRGRMHPVIAAGERQWQLKKTRMFAELRAGDIVTADVNGTRVRALVVAHLGDQVSVRTDDGVEHLIYRYAFGAVIRKGGSGG